MDKNKILKKKAKEISKYAGIVGPYDPYAKSSLPGFAAPSVPGGNSK